MKKVDLKVGPQTEPPIVEIDTEASCAYIRFNEKPVKKTVKIMQGTLTANADLDAGGEIIGFEVFGLKEFTIDTLMASQGINGILSRIPTTLLNKTRYVSAQPSEECEEDAVDLQMIRDRADEPTIPAEQVFKELGL